MRAQGRMGCWRGQGARRRHATPAQSRRAAKPHRRGAQDRHQSEDHRLAGPSRRRRDREENHRWAARRWPATSSTASPTIRSVWVIADVAEADIPSIKVGTPATVTLRSDQAAPVEGKVTFIYPELTAETRTVPVRIELPNPEQRMKDLDVCRRGVSGRRRRARGHRRARQRRHRQRHAGSRARCQGRGPLRAARGQARPPRRRLCRDHRGPQAGRGGRDLGQLPHRRREQSARRAAKLRPAGERSHDRGLIRWSARNVFLVGLATIFVTLAGLYARLARAARRDPRSLRCPGHRLHRISRPSAAGRGGPGHLSADHRDADRAEIARRARLLVFRRVLRLCDLRGWHRSLLGPLARARISEFCGAAVAGGGDPQPSGRTPPASVGSINMSCAATEEPRRASHHPGLVHPLRSRQGGRRRRGRERRRLRQAI